jgi:hypothetical protein
MTESQPFRFLDLPTELPLSIIEILNSDFYGRVMKVTRTAATASNKLAAIENEKHSKVPSITVRRCKSGSPPPLVSKHLRALHEHTERHSTDPILALDASIFTAGPCTVCKHCRRKLSAEQLLYRALAVGLDVHINLQAITEVRVIVTMSRSLQSDRNAPTLLAKGLLTFLHIHTKATNMRIIVAGCFSDRFQVTQHWNNMWPFVALWRECGGSGPEHYLYDLVEILMGDEGQELNLQDVCRLGGWYWKEHPPDNDGCKTEPMWMIRQGPHRVIGERNGAAYSVAL